MLVTRKETQEVELIDDVICNKCGKSCRDETTGLIEAVPLSMTWGYGSSKDGEGHESHVCEHCYDEIIAGFKIPPEVHEHLLLGGCRCGK